MNELTNFDQTLIKEQSNGYNGEKDASDASWKQVVISGVAGVMIGTLGSALLKPVPLNASEKTEEKEAEQSTESSESASIIYSDAPVAISVNDGMSFSEAFAAARSEVGAGGVFTWHGGVYGTYYANEWDNMSNAERNDFAQSVHQSPTPYHSDSYYAQRSSSRSVQSQADEDEGEVHVLGVEHVSTPNGSIVEVAAVEIDGERVALIDVDNDGIVDGMMADANHDGHISGNEIYDVEHMGIQMDELRMMNDHGHVSSYEDLNAGNSPDTYLDDFGA